MTKRQGSNARRNGLPSRPRTATLASLGALPRALTLGAAAPASAANITDCSADAVKVTVAGQSTINPITTAKSRCADSSSGLPNTTNAVGLAPAINARTAFAITDVTPDGARPLDAINSSAAGVEGLSIETAGGTVVIGVDAVRSFAQSRCTNGVLDMNGASTAVGLTINGQPATLDGPLEGLTDAISGSPLGALVTVKLNEQIRTGSSLIQRGARIEVLPALGAAPLAQVIIAESAVSSQGNPCDPNAPENQDTDGTGGDGDAIANACPPGSVFDAPTQFCVITAGASGGQGVVVVGRPFQTANGGTVISLNVARRRYGRNSICLTGAGPRFAVVGTSGNDRITGSNGPDRILGLSGNDNIDGGRGNDCIDGNAGRDILSGALGNDRVYGKTGNDALNGGGGNDILSGGSGNDTINAAYGADRVRGGSGNDTINVATMGPAARVSCGSGRGDTARINENEIRSARGGSCERMFLLSNRNRVAKRIR